MSKNNIIKKTWISCFFYFFWKQNFKLLLVNPIKQGTSYSSYGEMNEKKRQLFDIKICSDSYGFFFVFSSSKPVFLFFKVSMVKL